MPPHDPDSLVRALRTEIVTGALEPGAPMREVALAERFGVSRTPIREALTKLEGYGLVERDGRTLRVTAPDPERILNTYNVRIALEGEAAAEAAEHRQLSDLVELESLIARDRTLDRPSDAQRIETNLEFHAALWRAAHNPVLVELLERLQFHLTNAPHSTLSVGDRWAESLDEHEAIVAAIDARDPERARQLASAHMSTARELRIRLLREHARSRR
ncbi:GntR family transcriptional regulator [Leucobacter tenebrionis]|uniref:GntR family transcriptional regulator n=1 Tax=Leucobacter tenebrionis TaxID=2873270 RepID=UPI001CA6915F|nr:GntR family transcriptional regulator [Leucobacter tenebrionis]QZY51142.1 GntR family transcriptional regulator [Leucobacter tenebrionis]